MGLKMAKNIPKIYYVGDFLPFLDLLQPLKLYKNTEILKLVKNWFQKCIFLWEILQKIIAGLFRVSLFIDLGFP